MILAYEMWTNWKNMLINCFDKHAPLRSKRVVGNKKSPWITANYLKQKMRGRDFMQEKAKQTGDGDH
jgi:hypothetical protein